MQYQIGSLRKAEEISTMAQSSFHNILWKRLYNFSCKINVVPQLEDANYTACTECANWFQQTIRVYGSLSNRVVYSGEFVFHVNGRVNMISVKMRRTKRHQDKRERTSNNGKVIVWYLVSVKQVSGPYYYDGPTVTVARCKHLSAS